MDPFTRAIHADKDVREGADVAPAIRPSTTFLEDTGRRYRRDSHETTERFEAVLGSLEGGHAVCFSSGMAAASAALSFFRPDRIAVGDVYHGVRVLAQSLSDAGALVFADRSELQDGDIEWVETPSNPKCYITDLVATAEENRRRGVITIVDSTFATPVLMNPLRFGIDVVLHSVTKAIGGHSDAHAGVLVVSDDSVASAIRDQRSFTGGVPGSLDVWLALRGIRTLPLRMQRSTSTAGKVAAWTHERGLQTYYPGLSSHPGHEIARTQMSGYGSMLSLDVGSAAEASRVVRAVRLFTNATSLGGVESLIEHRILSDPAMDPGLIRISIGLEDPDDLIADLEQAL